MIVYAYLAKIKLDYHLFFCRLMGVCISRKLQINGGRTGLGASGTSNGANTMVLAKLINGPTSGAALTQTHSLRLAMLIFGMKGTYIHL